jgi:hypothetical protein
VVLDWSGVPGAAAYVVQVGTDEEWSDKPTLELDTVASRVTLPASLPHASYVWRVAAVGTDGQGRWSSNGTFTPGWSARAGAAGPQQRRGRPHRRRPDVPLDPVPAASEYQLQLSTSPYFTAPHRAQAGAETESCFTTRTSVTPFNGQKHARNDGAGDCSFTLLGKASTLYWRVRPLDQLVGGAPVLDTTPVVDEASARSRPRGRVAWTPPPAPRSPSR